MLEKQRSMGGSGAASQAAEDGGAAGGGADEATVKEMVDMGFTAEQVQQALRVCDNNEEHAIQFLLNNTQ